MICIVRDYAADFGETYLTSFYVTSHHVRNHDTAFANVIEQYERAAALLGYLSGRFCTFGLLPTATPNQVLCSSVPERKAGFKTECNRDWAGIICSIKIRGCANVV